MMESRRKKADLSIGKEFNEWTVLSFSHKREDSGNFYYLCRCSCGKLGTICLSRLKTGRSKMCQSCSGRINGRKGLDSQSVGSDLYIIRCGEYFKIGSSKEVYRRLKDLEGANPNKLELIYHGKGEGSDEAFWHSVFKHRHHRGEWFKQGDVCEVVDI